MNFTQFRTNNMRNIEVLFEMTGVRDLDTLRSSLHRVSSQPKEDQLRDLLEKAKNARDKLRGKFRQYVTHLMVKPLQFELKKIGPEQLDVAKKKELQTELSNIKPENILQYKKTRDVRDLFQTKGKRVTVWARLRRLAYMLMDVSK